MVGCIRRLLVRCKHGWPFDWPAAGREDAFRPFLVRDPENLIEPMNAPLAERAIRVIEVLAKASRVDAAVARAVERSQRRGAAPHIPIETGRNRLGGQWLLRAVADRRGEAAHHADRAHLAGAD